MRAAVTGHDRRAALSDGEPRLVGRRAVLHVHEEREIRCSSTWPTLTGDEVPRFAAIVGLGEPVFLVKAGQEMLRVRGIHDDGVKGLVLNRNRAGEPEGEPGVRGFVELLVA